MKNDVILRRLENIEDNARRLMNEAATLRDELSGGSDSSNSRQVLSIAQQENILNKRHKRAFKS